MRVVVVTGKRGHGRRVRPPKLGGEKVCIASFTMLPTGARSHRILRETHWPGWITNPFLAVAFVILQLIPGLTKDLFAGTIQPGMSAMLLSGRHRLLAGGERITLERGDGGFTSRHNFRHVDGDRVDPALGSVSLWRAGVYPLGAID